MVKKAAQKKQETKKAPVRRTRTISALIKDNENIVHEKLGQTRSKSNGVQQKQITKKTSETKQKNVINEKEKSAPKKNSNQKEEKQPIKVDTKQKKQPEVQDIKKPKETKQKVQPVQKKVISKKKSTPKKSPAKKSTPKKTPVKIQVAKEDKKSKASQKKNEKEVSKSEKKVEEKSEKKNNDKSEKKVIDKSEKKEVEKSEKKANDKSEKKSVEQLEKKSDKKGKSGKKEQQQQEQQEQKQTDSAKIPRRTESKAAAGIVDVVFCVDTTSSMGQYLNQTKNTVKEIIKNIKNKAQNEDISVRFGFVCYRDHPPEDSSYVTKIQDLCGEEEIIKFIDQQDAQGGGDLPEAVLDGLYDAAKKIEWRDARHTPSLKYIFHVADAPPHGKEFTELPTRWANGVPSGVTLDKVAHVINIREIHYRLINVNKMNLLDNMKKLFKEKFTNYEETDLSSAKEMDFRVSDMIIRELLPDVDYND